MPDREALRRRTELLIAYDDPYDAVHTAETRLAVAALEALDTQKESAPE